MVRNFEEYCAIGRGSPRGAIVGNSVSDGFAEDRLDFTSLVAAEDEVPEEVFGLSRPIGRVGTQDKDPEDHAHDMSPIRTLGGCADLGGM